VSTTATPDRFTSLPGEHALAATVTTEIMKEIIGRGLGL
jgi:hypothetical protein